MGSEWGNEKWRCADVMTESGSPDPKGFFDVVLHQRAHRQFADDPVADELVERCLRAATHAPSAENLQPWVFIVVRDPALPPASER